jgi:hypothetical protein
VAKLLQHSFMLISNEINVSLRAVVGSNQSHGYAARQCSEGNQAGKKEKE